jgi:hypothetical protein
MSQTVTFFVCFSFIFLTISIKKKTNKKVAPIHRITFICIQKVGLPCSRVGAGAGAASKFFTESA